MFLDNNSGMNTDYLQTQVKEGLQVNMLILSMLRFIIIKISEWKSKLNLSGRSYMNVFLM